ncbi:MAG: LysM peptidoglycan-binding domain-containing protein [Gammaproteobacteria bacterium]|nr:LysM peptidoglycan-binding domain-containing protein [Gammaproteobacteria bacterium]
MFRFVTTLLFMFVIGLPGAVVADEKYWEYTFRPGDSLWEIAKKYTTSVNNWSEIQSINQIRQGSDRIILPGTRIVIPVSMLKLQPTPAKVIALSGGASLVRANGEKDELEVGTLLYSGDLVVTEEKQNLRLQFADKSELQVLSNSEVVLDKLSHHKKTGMVDTRIRLNSGSVNTWVEKQNKDSFYEIKTPAAITAVRGTSFRLASDASFISRTEVTEGVVSVSASNTEQLVKEGYGIVAEKGKPLSEPIKLLTPPVLGENQSEDQSGLKLSWVKLDGAKFYRYQLAVDDKFNQVITENTIQENTIEMTELKPGRYYLRVRGIDESQLEGIDSVGNFLIKQAPVEDDSLRKIVIPAEVLLLNL